MGNCETCENVNHNETVTLLPASENTPTTSFALEELAKICPEPVKNTYLRLGEFNFTESFPYETKPPVELDNGAIYYGQWKDGKQEGRGRQVWKDGTFYEGYWSNGMANG